jgi:RHS repeat-associated protein
VASKNVYGVVTQTVSYEYDVNDRRLKKTVDGVVEKYFLDGDNIAFVTDGVGDRTFHYLYGLEADQVLAQDSETGMVWSLADRLGSIDVLVNEQGVIVDQRTYDSFGNTLSQLDPTVKFRFGYTGRESDPETGLYYYRARYFDANVGRFISTDPIGFEAGDSNLYRYVFNNSTTYTDPSGKIIPLLLGAAFVGGLFGGAYGVADHIEKGGTLDNINWGDIGGKAAFGAFAGAGITALAVGVAAGAAAYGVLASTIAATGLVLGAAATGWGIGSGIYNIANGKPLTGSLDLIGGVLGLKGLHSGYKGYKDAIFSENIDKLAKETRATISSIEDWQVESGNIPGLHPSSPYQVGEIAIPNGINLPYKSNNSTLNVYNPLANQGNTDLSRLISSGRLTGNAIDIGGTIRLNNIRQSAAVALGKTSNSQGLSNAKSSNSSFADVWINNRSDAIRPDFQLKGFAGVKDISGYVPNKAPHTRLLKPRVIRGNDRGQDAEAKILEEILVRTGKHDKI